MMLTQRQETMITRYLRDVADGLGDVSDEMRERVVRRLKNRIFAELRKGSGLVDDTEVEAVLARLGTASEQAIQSAQTPAGSSGLTLSVENRRWLGVCGGVAGYFGLNPVVVRAFFLLLGVTGPIAVIVYLALYFEMYRASESEGIPRIDPWRTLGRAAAVIIAVLALDLGMRGLLHFVRYGYERFPSLGPYPGLEQWDWLPVNMPFLLFCALSLSAPLAILSGLPLAGEWDTTLKRCAQAILAVYAAILSIGFALYITGIIVHIAKGFTL